MAGETGGVGDAPGDGDTDLFLVPGDAGGGGARAGRGDWASGVGGASEAGRAAEDF